MRQNETEDPNAEYERYIHERIATIQHEYQRAIEPLVKELVRIEALRPRQMRITPELAEQLGLLNKK